MVVLLTEPLYLKKEAATAELKHFLLFDDYNIREQLLWTQRHQLWWFYSTIAYLFFAKADSTIKREIFSLWQQQSVSWRLTHLSNIMCDLCDRFLTQWWLIINPFMITGRRHFTFVTSPFYNWMFPFMRTVRNFYSDSESMQHTQDHLWWRRKTFILLIMSISSDNYNIDWWINRFHGKLSPNSNDLTDFTANPGNFTQFTDVRGIFTENDGNFAGILSIMAESLPNFMTNSDQLTQFINVPTIFTRQDRAFKRYWWSQHEIWATITMMAEHFVTAEDLCDFLIHHFQSPSHIDFF